MEIIDHDRNFVADKQRFKFQTDGLRIVSWVESGQLSDQLVTRGMVHSVKQ